MIRGMSPAPVPDRCRNGAVRRRADLASAPRLAPHARRGTEDDVSQKVIGLIGGMSWESSAEYYRIINQAVRARLGGLRSARCLMWSFDFGEIEALQHAGRWDDAAAEMIAAARRLERGGADFVVICTNTMHRMADEVQAAIGLPLLHIADPTAERIRSAGMGRVGLLGTAFTMEHDFYKGTARGPARAGRARAGRRRPRPGAPGDLRGAGAGPGGAVLASRLPRGDRPAGGARRGKR